jgi:bifunctional non-homologous end joining protein LigD
MNKRQPKVKYKVSSPDRVIDKASGATKQDVADYYAEVLDRLFPHVKDRPISLIRCPGGLAEPCFYQRHPLQGKQDGIEVVDVGDEKYISIVEPVGVLTMVQYGAIEFHPWGANSDAVGLADRLIFDLDPDTSWDRTKDAARLLRDILQEMGFEPYARLSGGKGVHLVCCIKPEIEWDQVKAFAKALVYKLAKDYPDDFVPVMTKKDRKDKIYIDYLRNDTASTAVTNYSLRARPGLPVAVPIKWDELDEFKPDHFHIGEVADRIKEDPWSGFLDKPASLKKVLDEKG